MPKPSVSHAAKKAVARKPRDFHIEGYSYSCAIATFYDANNIGIKQRCVYLDDGNLENKQDIDRLILWLRKARRWVAAGKQRR